MTPVSVEDNAAVTLRPKVIVHYLLTRVPSLRPPMKRPPNPLKQLAGMTRRTWLLFFVGFVSHQIDFTDASLPGLGTALTFSVSV